MAAADNADTPLNAKGATGFGVRTLLHAALGNKGGAMQKRIDLS